MKKLIIGMCVVISILSFIIKDVEITKSGLMITFLDNTGYYQEF